MPEPFNFLEDLTDEEVSQKEKEFYGSHKNLKLTETPFKTQYGRKVYKDQYGQKHSESSVTIQDSKGRWMNVPTIFNGEYVDDGIAGKIIENNKYLDPETNEQIKTFETEKDAVKEAVKRNRSLNKSDQSWNEDNTGLNKRETKDTMQITYEQARKKLRQGLPPSEKKISSMTNREWSWLMGNKPDWFGTGERDKKTGLRSFAPPNVYDDPNTLSGGDTSVADANTLAMKEALANQDSSGVPPVPTPNVTNPLADPGSTTKTFAGPSSTTKLDDPVEKLQKKVMGAAGDIMDTEYEAYDPTKRFEGQSTDTTQSFTDTREMQGTGQEAYTTAGDTAAGVQGTNIDPITGQSFLTGTGVDEYMSPHTANVIKGMQDSAMRTMQKQRGALQAQHQMAGAGMGSRGALENAAMAGEVQRNLGQQVSGALEGSYAQAAKMKEGDMKRKLEADRYNQLAKGEEGRLRLAGAETGIRATDAGRAAGYTDASMLSNVGADLEGRDQNQMDVDYGDFLEERDWDKNNTMFASNVLGGAPSGTKTTATNPMARGNKLGGAIGAGLTGWAASGGNPYMGLAAGAGSLLAG